MLDPELRAWIDQVVADTKSRLIVWKMVNPSTYVWEMTQPHAARVVLQRVERLNQTMIAPGRIQARKEFSHFVFQVFDLTKPAVPIVQTNTQEDPSSADALLNLYDAVTGVESKETLNFLNSLLPKKPAT